MTDLVVEVLATWRFASLLYEEDGPWEVFAKIRDVAGISYDEQSYPSSDKEIGKMLLCFWCTSIWAAVLISLMSGHFAVVRILASSAGAVLVHLFQRRLSVKEAK